MDKPDGTPGIACTVCKVWMVGNHPVNLTPRRQEAPTSAQAGGECVHIDNMI